MFGLVSSLLKKKKTDRCTMNKRSIEPLHVVALWEGEQHLIGQNGNGEKEHSTDCNRQGECAQPQPGKRRNTICECCAFIYV